MIVICSRKIVENEIFISLSYIVSFVYSCGGGIIARCSKESEGEGEILFKHIPYGITKSF